MYSSWDRQPWVVNTRSSGEGVQFVRHTHKYKICNNNLLQKRSPRWHIIWDEAYTLMQQDQTVGLKDPVQKYLLIFLRNLHNLNFGTIVKIMARKYLFRCSQNSMINSHNTVLWKIINHSKTLIAINSYDMLRKTILEIRVFVKTTFIRQFKFKKWIRSHK